MVAKKTDKANLENKKIVFFEIGLAIALALGLIALEWKSAGETTNDYAYLGGTSIDSELDIDITRPEVKQEIKPPMMKKIVIADPSIDIEDPTIDFTVEIDPFDAIYIPEPADEDSLDHIDYVIIAQEMPKYRKGGLENFHKYIQDIVRYPQQAIDLRLEGKVFVKFIVNKQGYVTHIEVIQGIDPLLDNEVIAAINKSERWKPGRQNGLPVNVAMSMPVIFRLQ